MTTLSSAPAGATPAGYGAVAKLLHWLIVALVVAQFTIGWLMPDLPRSRPPEGLVTVHLSIGAIILLVMVVRIAWRLTHGAPASIVAIAWQRRLACTVHTLLYALLIVAPLAGWAWASAKGWPVVLFGVELPQLVPTNWPHRALAASVHRNTGWAIMALVALHALAALRHHFALRDGVLRRMLP